jgi:hypothetical protein
VSLVEEFRTLYCDPGEDFGFCFGVDTRLLGGGTEKMWTMVHDVWDLLENPGNEHNILNTDAYLREGVDPELMKLPVERIVCEDFRIYPWKCQDLKWDRVRTARAIGALTFMAQHFDIPMILQGANIKPSAVAAGAEELYWKPLHENRHQNDAIQHFVYYTNVELLGLILPIPEEQSEEIYQ